MDRKKRLSIACVFIALVAFGVGMVFLRQSSETSGLVLYGNVDQRQVELAFLDVERVAEVLVEEGEEVQKGQVLARLETRRLRDRIRVAEAGVLAASAQLEKLLNGSRPEEKEQARAQRAVAIAELSYAEKQYRRLTEIAANSRGTGVRKSEIDQAFSQLNAAKARLHLQENTVRLAEIGPRQEEIAQAKALLEERVSTVVQLKNQLLDAELKSPAHSRVNRRLLEPGDMAQPQRAVFSLLVLSPKWVRVYVDEAHMGMVKTGKKAVVRADSLPDAIPGTVSFLSSIAEFTPKSVETTELRTSLVYEVRIRVDDKQDLLRLGMPVTVDLE